MARGWSSRTGREKMTVYWNVNSKKQIPKETILGKMSRDILPQFYQETSPGSSGNAQRWFPKKISRPFVEFICIRNSTLRRIIHRGRFLSTGSHFRHLGESNTDTNDTINIRQLPKSFLDVSQFIDEICLMKNWTKISRQRLFNHIEGRRGKHPPRSFIQ